MRQQKKEIPSVFSQPRGAFTRGRKFIVAFIERSAFFWSCGSLGETSSGLLWGHGWLACLHTSERQKLAGSLRAVVLSLALSLKASCDELCVSPNARQEGLSASHLEQHPEDGEASGFLNGRTASSRKQPIVPLGCGEDSVLECGED